MDNMIWINADVGKPCPKCHLPVGVFHYGDYYRCSNCLTYFDNDMNPISDTLHNTLERLGKRTRELWEATDMRMLCFVFALVGMFLTGATLEHYGWLWFLW